MSCLSRRPALPATCATIREICRLLHVTAQKGTHTCEDSPIPGSQGLQCRSHRCDHHGVRKGHRSRHPARHYSKDGDVTTTGNGRRQPSTLRHAHRPVQFFREVSDGTSFYRNVRHRTQRRRLKPAYHQSENRNINSAVSWRMNYHG